MKNFPLKTLVVAMALQPYVTQAETAENTGALVVTARHWPEEVAQIPVSVTVDRFENTDSALLSDLRTAVEGTPNVQVEVSSVQTRVVLRGVTAVNTGLQDPLGYFIDGVALPLGANQAPILFNLAQTELVKGPQGALYGRNTESGAFKVTTRAPHADGEAWLNVSGIRVEGPQGGDGDQTRTIVAVGGSSALTELLSIGVAARVEEGGSGQHNFFDASEEGGNIERRNLSVSADLDLSERTDISLRSHVEVLDNGMERMRYASGAFQTAPHTTNYNRTAENERDTQVHSLTVNHEMDGMQLTAVTGLTDYKRNFVMDLDATILPAPASKLDQDNQMISQELRLSSVSDPMQLKWLVGAYLFDEESNIEFVTGVPSTSRVTRIEQNGVAVYGHFEYPLSDRLRVSAGARVEYLDMSGAQARSSFLGATAYAQNVSNTEVLPRLGIAYDLDGNSQLYASVARGYLPGGYNYNLASGSSDFTYGSEFSDTVEAGFKTAYLDDRIHTDVALFFTRSTDKQLVDLQPGGTQRISNAAEADIYGLEVAVDADLGMGWRGFADLGLMHSEATEYETQLFNGTGFVAADLSGNELPMVAPLTYGLGLSYDSSSAWFGEVRWKGVGDFYFDSQNLINQKAYHTVDLEIGYRFPAMHGLTVSLAARNLFDESYYIRAVNTPNGLLVEDGSPREISLNIAARW